MAAGRLSGRSAVITGAADGIGYGMAVRFAGEGAAVLVSDIDEAKGREVVAQLRSTGGRAEFARCDVTKRDEVIGVVAACVDHFGAVDILVNNAYRGNGVHRIENKTDDLFEYGLTSCLYAAKWSMEAAFPHMKAAHWGRIVNICSLNGVNAHIGTAEYNVGKEALRAYTRTAAREWAGYGICANIICPAAVSAAFKRYQAAQPEAAAASAGANPMGRMGDPELDIAPVALFLASEDARYLTGNTLFVDGGSHINGAVWLPTLSD
jgi:NAD(P)-dependent dehydrogenase (short-subunit alcohol dehydrogenase family)